MRKITNESVSSFERNQKFAKANMMVSVNESETVLLLHGNEIAKKVNGELFVTLAGWNTPTTRARLNGLDGVNVYTKKGQAYLNGNAWDGEWTKI